MRTRMAILRRFVWGLVACVGTVSPRIGWSTTLSDKPLFLESNVAHNLMFVVDDSGSMDFEVLAPAVGAVGAIIEGYLFDVGMARSTGNYWSTTYWYDGKRLTTRTAYDYTRRYFYLRSTEYNRSYYDPSVTYLPWPKGDGSRYDD